MKRNQLTRRQFIQRSAVAVAGTALLSPWGALNSSAAVVKRTATDQVTLGQTGIKLSRLGIGTGVNSGHDQVGAGKDAFITMVRHAYDSGITYIDTAERYETFGWIGDAIKGLPREKLFIQSKVPNQPEDVLAAIDRHRKTLNTDYIDSLLIHCMTKDGWTDEWKRVMDGFNEAKERKWIRAKGVSCHTLAALRNAVDSNWTEVHLVRINPQGRYMDGVKSAWGPDSSVDVNPVVEQIKTMHAKGHGVIGMKIFGNGDFKNPGDREKSIRFAMSKPEINAVVIGFTAPPQIDETIQRMNRILAES
ncbi:MAG TPA: aldo/keto reductase [Verrucomicrobiae bacterium]|jgi:predicted aldo/keto reductase-like oxidoreductase|nr:aldo/keto reductase [Verrucomicrobiae bacterium]